MPSFSGYVFSCRMSLSKIKRHKLAVSISVLFVLAILVLGPPVYQESWLDPFRTLNVPNQELRPHSITKLGMVNSDDPFHPYYYTNVGKIRELMHDLQRSTPLSESDQALVFLDNQKVQYFTLHRALSHYHTEQDYALQYYPEKSIVRFRQQAFRINEAAVYTFTQIAGSMTSGWWK